MKQFIQFLHRYRAHNLGDPKRIPVTMAEIVELSSNYNMIKDPNLDGKNKVMGFDAWITPYASEIRTRQLDMPVDVLSETAEVDAKSLVVKKEENQVFDRLFYQLGFHCCTDTTEIKIIHEWDVFGWLKKKLRLTRWWPVKTRTAVIDGRILYPYLKVSLPANRHTVRFALKP